MKPSFNNYPQPKLATTALTDKQAAISSSKTLSLGGHYFQAHRNVDEMIEMTKIVPSVKVSNRLDIKEDNLHAIEILTELFKDSAKKEQLVKVIAVLTEALCIKNNGSISNFGVLNVLKDLNRNSRLIHAKSLIVLCAPTDQFAVVNSYTSSAIMLFEALNIAKESRSWIDPLHPTIERFDASSTTPINRDLQEKFSGAIPSMAAVKVFVTGLKTIVKVEENNLKVKVMDCLTYLNQAAIDGAIESRRFVMIINQATMDGAEPLNKSALILILENIVNIVGDRDRELVDTVKDWLNVTIELDDSKSQSIQKQSLTNLFGLINLSGDNNCFINSAIQFILNNDEFLIIACLTHPDLEFRQCIKELIYERDKSVPHAKLIDTIRSRFVGKEIEKNGQESSAYVLGNLFHSNPKISCIRCTNRDDISQLTYDVFKELDSVKEDIPALLNIINNFTTTDNGKACTAYDNLKNFVNNNEDLKLSFGYLFDNMGYATFCNEIISNEVLQLGLQCLIKDQNFQNKLTEDHFTWVDTSGFGCSVLGQQTELPLQVSEIPNNEHLNAIIVHLGMQIEVGHYVCYARKEKDWILFDDNRIINILDLEKSITEIKGKIIAFSYYSDVVKSNC